MVSNQVIKYASIFYGLAKFADLKANLATRVMLSAVPALVQKGIKKKYGEKGETDPETILKMQAEIKESVDKLVSKLSPVILAGALELIRYAPDIIAKELSHAMDPSRNDEYGQDEQTSEKFEHPEGVFRKMYEENPDKAYTFAEECFNNQRMWAEMYGGPPWAKYAKYNGLLNHELNIATKLGDQSREFIQEHGQSIWQGSKLQDEYYKSCVNVSRYVNFIDALEHNTGSFFTKLVSRQSKAGLGPGSADGTGVNDYGEYMNYYSDLMKLTDAKELTNEDDVLAIIAPFKKDLPETVRAYLPSDTTPSNKIDENLLNIRFNRILGSDIDSVIKVIRTATRNNVSERMATNWVYNLNSSSDSAKIFSLFSIFTDLANISNPDLLYKAIDALNYPISHISQEAINKVKNMFAEEIANKLNEWGIDLTKKKPAPPKPEEAQLKGLTFIATSFDGGFFVNDEMKRLYRVKLPHIYRLGGSWGPNTNRTLIGPINVGDSWNEMYEAESEIRKFTMREAQKMDTPDLRPKLPPISNNICMIEDGSGTNKFYVHNYIDYPQIFVVTQGLNLSHFSIDIQRMSQRFQDMIKSIPEKVYGKAASTNLFSKKTKRS